MRKFLASLLGVLDIALMAVGAVVLVRTFLVQPFLVSGESMQPTFASGNYLLVDQLTPRLRDIERGEVIVFEYPVSPNTYFIKRAVGLPGERVVVEDGAVTIYNDEHPEGFVLAEPYLPPGLVTTGNSEFQLADDEYVVFGDNRPYSFDSRSWGTLSKEHIVGLVRLRLWPPTGVQVFAAPQY